MAPNPEALALGPTIGWLSFVCVLAFAALIVLDRERWRKFWLRTEDPRSIAAFRVALAAMLLVNVNNMAEHFELLFTDEGLFMAGAARQHLGGVQFAGYAEGLDGEPRGFVDLAAVLQWARGPRLSLLYFWDSPQAFRVQLVVWELATVALLLGFRTRLSAVLSLVLTLGFMNRAPLYLSGADIVTRVMLVYLVLARCGHAYSIDNWLRCRRLARAGKLDTREGPGVGAGVAPSEVHPEGLAAIYRRIPAWPRTLIILQLAMIYFWTGCAKTGEAWSRGDALYYALNLDHFNRVPTQFITYVFGDNLFRLMTWVVHGWQIGFPLMVLGLIVRWARREGLEAPTGARRWGLRVAWIALGLGALAIIWVGLPVHVSVDEQGASKLWLWRWLSLGLGLGSMALIAWGWARLRDRPFVWTVRGRALTLDALFSVVGGRRVWLTLGLIFHLHILVLMNIGTFAPVMLAVYVACLNGTEIAGILRRLARRLGMSRWVGGGQGITPSEALSLPHLHHDRRAVSVVALALAFALVAVAILVNVLGFGWWWWLMLAGVFLPAVQVGASALLMRVGLVEPGRNEDDAPPWTWAHGCFGRVLVGTLIAVHIAALAARSIPDKACTASFRAPALAVALPWLHATQTFQSWNMFAPNPARSNMFMKVFVVDQDDERWDLYTDVNSPRNKVMPWFIYNRMDKISRRALGEGHQYLKWIARYHCREWALEHEGELPKSVEIVRHWYRIPPPEEMREQGPYDPRERIEAHGSELRAYTVQCATELDAQPSNEQRRRHGLEPVPEEEIHRAVVGGR